MNFLKDLTKSSSEPKAPNEASPPDLKESNSDLFANAKVVAEAAQAQFSQEPKSYDKAKAAGAGAEILDAGEKYAKLDEYTGAGKYVEQAEDYLRKYGQDSKPVDAPLTAAATPPVADSAAQHVADAAPPVPAAAAEVTEPEKKEESAGGAGDLFKKAGGLFK